jgi:predicted PurR-regulated permease PerM
MNISFNNRIRQLLLLGVIIILGFILVNELYLFLPGLLGGLTLYILTRGLYFRLTIQKKWKKGLTALLFILGCLVIFSIPFYMAVKMISPKVNDLINNQDKLISGFKIFSEEFKQYSGIELLSDENTKALTQRISSLVPKLINSTASILSNLLMMFFLLYYLCVNGIEIEKYLGNAIPLKPSNIDKLAKETRLMITANAVGIPIICIIQGIFATFGYWIFGVNDWGMWGFLTGVFAFFPLVGTMIIWVPIVLYLFATGNTWMATGLTIYSFIVTGNVDYIARLTLLKKIGDVHPMITILGVIAGLNLFGFMGFIFGPLLVSYFIILIKIYMNEFTETQ